MDLPQEEQERLAIFSKYVQSEELEKALDFARMCLEQSPEHAGLWHSQTGALVFEVEEDEVLAFEHYHKSLELGFDAIICEENMWEAAEVFFLSLKTKEGTFNAIIILPEEEGGTHKSLRANHLLKKYVAIFPMGQFVSQANTYLAEFDQVTGN